MESEEPLATHELAANRGTVPFWTWRRMLFFTACLVVSVVAGAGFGTMATFMGEMPLASDLRAFQPSLTTKMYDCNGHLITELFTEQRTLIRLDNVPDHLQKGVIAIEDAELEGRSGMDVASVQLLTARHLEL